MDIVKLAGYSCTAKHTGQWCIANLAGVVVWCIANLAGVVVWCI